MLHGARRARARFALPTFSTAKPTTRAARCPAGTRRASTTSVAAQQTVASGMSARAGSHKPTNHPRQQGTSSRSRHRTEARRLCVRSRAEHGRLVPARRVQAARNTSRSSRRDVDAAARCTPTTFAARNRPTLHAARGRPEIFEPHFTYHGFRYVQVNGLTTQTATRCDSPAASLIRRWPKPARSRCRTPLLNKLWQNVLWTQRGQHDRAFPPTVRNATSGSAGWATSRCSVGTGIFNMDMAAFFTKWMRDVRDAQTPDGRFADFSPQPFARKTRSSRACRDGGRRRRSALAHVAAVRRQASSARTTTARRGGSNSSSQQPRSAVENDAATTTATGSIRHVSIRRIPRKGGEVPKAGLRDDDVRLRHGYRLTHGRRARTTRRVAQGNTAHFFDDIKTAFNRAYVTEDGHIRETRRPGTRWRCTSICSRRGCARPAARYMVDGIERYHGTCLRDFTRLTG